MRDWLRRYLSTAAATTALVAPAVAFDGWHLEQATIIEGKGSAWDYVSLDSAHDRLFIGHRKEGLQVFDLNTRKLVKIIDGTPAASSNGATLVPEHDLAVSNNENGTIIPFHLSTLEAQGPIKLGEGLDNSHYDAVNQRIAVNMAADKDGSDVVLIEVPSLAVAGKVRLPSTKLEGGGSDGKGAFFIAARDTNKVFRIDTKAAKLLSEWPTPGCAQTNGLTVDAVHRRVFLGCRGSDTVKPSFAVMNADSGAVIYTSEIGGGNDAVVYDADLKRVFLANGVGAVINIFEQVDADTYRPVETLGTRAGVRTMAIDPKTKRLHAVGGEGSADAGKKILTSVSPFYANTFFPNTFTVLTFVRQ